MMSSPRRSFSKTPPAAPLFVRDRYGSNDSTSTLDEVEPKPIDDSPSEPNAWAESASEKTPAEPDARIPPADHGVKAWTVLAAAALIEGFLWGKKIALPSMMPQLTSAGFPLSYGVFQEYYFNKDGPFEESKNLPTIGVLAMGCHYLGAPLMAIFTENMKGHRRLLICLGWPLCISGLIAASFAQTIVALIMTQGFLYSFGVLILYLPLTSMVNEWFEERRGLAYGIITASTGITGAVLPFLASFLLERFSHPWTLRIFAALLAGVTLPALFPVRPRFPPATLAPAPAKHTLTRTYLRLLQTPLFHLYSLANILHALASFLPSIFLPQHATSLGLASPVGALLLATLFLCQVVGQLAVGSLSDRRNLHALAVASPLLAAVAVFALWGPARSLPWLAAFAAVYGLAAPGFVVLWARMGAAFVPPPPPPPTPSTAAAAGGVARSSDGSARSAMPLATFGLFSFQKGLGGVLAGPIAGRLMRETVSVGAYGSGKYIWIVVFTGVCMFASAAVVVGWYALPKRFRDLGLERREEVLNGKS